MAPRVCEVCGVGSETAVSAVPLRRLVIDNRVIALCPEHYELVEQEEIQNLAELFARFREAGGRRASMSRRSPVDRRAFPPRPEGRRHNGGRRQDD